MGKTSCILSACETQYFINFTQSIVDVKEKRGKRKEEQKSQRDSQFYNNKITYCSSFELDVIAPLLCVLFVLFVIWFLHMLLSNCTSGHVLLPNTCPYALNHKTMLLATHKLMMMTYKKRWVLLEGPIGNAPEERKKQFV